MSGCTEHPCKTCGGLYQDLRTGDYKSMRPPKPKTYSMMLESADGLLSKLRVMPWNSPPTLWESMIHIQCDTLESVVRVEMNPRLRIRQYRLYSQILVGDHDVTCLYKEIVK